MGSSWKAKLKKWGALQIPPSPSLAFLLGEQSPSFTFSTSLGETRGGPIDTEICQKNLCILQAVCYILLCIINWTFFRSLAPHPPRPAAAHDGPRHLLSQEDNSQPVDSQIFEHQSSDSDRHLLGKGNSQPESQTFEEHSTRNSEVHAHQQPAGEKNELLERERQARWEKWTIQKHSMIIIIPLPKLQSS